MKPENPGYLDDPLRLIVLKDYNGVLLAWEYEMELL